MTTPTLITRKHSEVSQEHLDQAVLEADTAWRQAKKDKPFSHYLAKTIAAKVLPPIVSIQLPSLNPEDLQALLAAANEPDKVHLVAVRQPTLSTPEGWKWMTHPDWNNGQPIPVRITADGFYQPFDFDATEFEWAERDEAWAEWVGQLRTKPVGTDLFRQQFEADSTARPTQRRTVTIPAREEHEGYAAITVSLPWTCIHCGSPRGEPVDALSYDGSMRLKVHSWTNPCGHIEKYSDIRARLQSEGGAA